MSAALIRVGMKAQYHYVPWMCALIDAKDGVFEGIVCLYPTEERGDTLSFSEPVLAVGEVIISHEDNPFSCTGRQE